MSPRRDKVLMRLIRRKSEEKKGEKEAELSKDALAEQEYLQGKVSRKPELVDANVLRGRPLCELSELSSLPLLSQVALD